MKWLIIFALLVSVLNVVLYFISPNIIYFIAGNVSLIIAHNEFIYLRLKR